MSWPLVQAHAMGHDQTHEDTRYSNGPPKRKMMIAKWAALLPASLIAD